MSESRDSNNSIDSKQKEEPKFAENQIIKSLDEQAQGKSVCEIRQPPFYGWKSKYGVMDVYQLK